MTKNNKLIVGAVVVLGAYFLYQNYKVKSEVEDLKDGADYPAPPPPIENHIAPTLATAGIKLSQEDSNSRKRL